MGFIRNIQLFYFSKPVEDRIIYRTLKELNAHRILEIAIHKGVRSQKMIELATELCGEPEKVHFYGIDPFEGRTPADGPGISLRKAHHLLKATGAQIRLTPGEPCMALMRSANSMKDIDLVIIDTPKLAWFETGCKYLPRILAENARILVGKRRSAKSPPEYKILTPDQITKLVERSDKKNRRKAA